MSEQLNRIGVVSRGVGLVMIPFTLLLVPTMLPPPDRAKGEGVGTLIAWVFNVFQGGEHFVQSLILLMAFAGAAALLWMSGWMLKAQSPGASIAAQALSLVLMMSMYVLYGDSVELKPLVFIPLVFPVLLAVWTIAVVARGRDAE